MNIVEGTEIWQRMPGEPRNWYMRFQRYYLYRGLARSIRRAYQAFLKENYPEKWEEMSVVGRGYHTWKKYAIQFNWKDRAESWDAYRNDMLQREVLEASRYLMEHASDAAEALVEALTSSRLTVSAANSILDRIGLPTVARQELTHSVTTMSADDLAKIKSQLEAWEASLAVSSDD